MMRKLVLAATVAAVLLPGAAAQAAPAANTEMLGTYDFGRAAVIAAGGRAAGVWADATVRSGIAGDDLIVTYAPRSTAYPTEKLVYTALYNEVGDPQAECLRVGAEGLAKKVWLSFRCRTGVAPNYTLLVR